MLVFSVASTAVTIYLAIKDPKLLERRMKVGPWAEQEKSQKIIMTITLLGFIGMIVFPAFDFRFKLSPVPWYISLIGEILVLLGFLFTFFVVRENSYSAATIQIAEDQKVISTGPYAIVRHPMYAGAFVMLVGMPLALGSWLGLLALFLVIPVIIWRLLDEERILSRDLPGYIEYQKKVRWRLLPGVF